MKNLAFTIHDVYHSRDVGHMIDYYFDGKVKEELEYANITVLKDGDRYRGEVPTQIYGREVNGCVLFNRAWYYWVVEGNFPEEFAYYVYDTIPHEHSVRVDGHADHQDPRKRSYNYKWVSTYHIDSLEGLKMFVEALKAWYF